MSCLGRRGQVLFLWARRGCGAALLFVFFCGAAVAAVGRILVRAINTGTPRNTAPISLLWCVGVHLTTPPAVCRTTACAAPRRRRRLINKNAETTRVWCRSRRVCDECALVNNTAVCACVSQLPSFFRGVTRSAVAAAAALTQRRAFQLLAAAAAAAQLSFSSIRAQTIAIRTR